jgi:hypothetical protein
MHLSQVRDTFPHDVLVATPCGHAYSERCWSEVISTQIERHGAHTFRARKARCCAPLEGGGICGKPLSEAQALRVTGCRRRLPRYRHDDDVTAGAADEHGATQPPPPVASAAAAEGSAAGGPGGSALPRAVAPTAARADGAGPSSGLVDLRRVGLHGSWGSRVEAVVRLLLALRDTSASVGDACACKAVVFSRHEQLLHLIDRACAMNGVAAARFGASGGQHTELAKFVAPTLDLQALLLSAQRDASGLTLTAASHVIIVEPQPDVAVEQQMVGRVHRIGQTRQTHVHRLVVAGSFELTLATERLAGAAKSEL